jgi:hypothetical protein
MLEGQSAIASYDYGPLWAEGGPTSGASGSTGVRHSRRSIASAKVPSPPGAAVRPFRILCSATARPSIGTGGPKRVSSARGRTGELIENAMGRVDVYRMIRRRARDARLDADICCHRFRATGITDYLENSGTLENAQAMAHESPRTTKL